MEHSPVRGTSRCAPGAFSLTAPVFIKPACAKRGLVRTGQHLGGRAWCARRVNYSQASSEPTAAPTPKATHQPHHQHQKPRANQTSSPGNITHQPASTASPTRINRITNTRNRAPIKPAAPATPHITSNQSHTPTTSPAPEATRQSNQQPRQHHTSTRSNRSTSTRSHTPTTSPAPENRAPIKPAAPATPHINPHQPQHQRQEPAPETTRHLLNASCTATGRRRTFP